MALVHQIIDFVDDIDKSLLKQAAAHAPEFVRCANILTHEDRERLAGGDFALVMRTKEAQVLRKFPVTDGPNTWLSCYYFSKTAEQLPPLAQKIAATNLKRACLVYDLDLLPEIEKLSSNQILSNTYDEVQAKKDIMNSAPVVKIASYTPDNSAHFYALVGRYPMPDGEYVKKAAAYFEEHHREFTEADDRFQFAENVLARAQELGVEITSSTLKKYASDQYGTELSQQLRMRREIAGRDLNATASLQKLASLQPETDPKTFAKALFAFDKKAGIAGHYGNGVKDAFEATFASPKIASGYQWDDEQSGLSLSESALVKAADERYEKIKSYFGPTLADSLKKHAVAIFDSLPGDAKIAVAKIAKGDL